MSQRRSLQQGFAAIAAIFLVVVLAALGAFMLTFSNVQQVSSAQDVLGSRAYWAARSGVEWGVSKVVSLSACPAASTTLTIDSWTVKITCTVQSFNEAGTAVRIFQLASVASTTGAVGSVGFIERSLSVSLEQ